MPKVLIGGLLIRGVPRSFFQNFLPFRPTRENHEIDRTNSTFLTECPITKYNNGDFHHHDVMLGYTRDEVLLFLGRKYRALFSNNNSLHRTYFTFLAPIGVANMIDWALKYVKHASELKVISKEPIDLFARTISDLYKTSYRKLEKVRMIFFLPSSFCIRSLVTMSFTFTQSSWWIYFSPAPLT